MAVSQSSRYQRHRTAIVVDRAGRRQVAIMRRVPTAQRVRVLDALWQESDRVDTLAGRYVGSPLRWWAVAELNPGVLDWTRPAPGSPVMIPRGLA
ncbi:hypothetical protein ACFVGM_08860 [Kitasatospora purpeofusca]|uniref:hypothetical protein n=1 Tax=Kitasatospora purpeofusca TaxID=67352 RepID=UPI0036BF50D9